MIDESHASGVTSVAEVGSDAVPTARAKSPTSSTRHLPPSHPALPSAKIGVLLLNLGTPDGTDYRSMYAI